MKHPTILPATIAVTVGGRPATYLDAGMGSNGEYLMTRHNVLFIVLGEAPGKDGSVPAYVTEAFGGLR